MFCPLAARREKRKPALSVNRPRGVANAYSSTKYPAMYEIGPENFTFEILEECTTDKLNERE